ncbi:MAG TPA: hypothetical protein PK110_05705 [Niabella sp.]|jgi:hypothetical protein|nr:hypothetical protein [Niabella sp.]
MRKSQRTGVSIPIPIGKKRASTFPTQTKLKPFTVHEHKQNVIMK